MDADIKEILKIAAELLNYARTMPTDPYARRRRLCGEALIAKANAMAGEA